MVKVTFRPTDSRCNYYAQLITPDDAIPAMADFRFLPGKDVRRQTVTLRPGDWVLTGEARHHRKLRGWDVVAHTVGDDGTHWTWTPDSKTKDALKAWVSRGPDRKGDAKLRKRGLMPRLDLRREDLKGAGDPAALLRLVHADRAGVTIDRVVRTEQAFGRLRRMEESRAARERAVSQAAHAVRMEAAAAARREVDEIRADAAAGVFDIAL